MVVELEDVPAKLIGNLLGDVMQEPVIGPPMKAVFEHHEGYTLVQWERR